MPKCLDLWNGVLRTCELIIYVECLAQSLASRSIHLLLTFFFLPIDTDGRVVVEMCCDLLSVTKKVFSFFDPEDELWALDMPSKKSTTKLAPQLFLLNLKKYDGDIWGTFVIWKTR